MTTNRQLKCRELLIVLNSPSLSLFDRGQDSITRLLFVWAFRHKACGYVQGINDLVTPFMAVFLEEKCKSKSPVSNEEVGN